MRKLKNSDIASAMFSSLEGYATYVVESIEFSLQRQLSEDESKTVYAKVSAAVEVATREVEASHA